MVICYWSFVICHLSLVPFVHCSLLIDMPPHFAIIGSGALACLFASRLQAVAPVTLIGTWPEQMAVLARDGLLVEELDGRTTHHAIRALPATAAPPTPWADVAIVLVKSTQTAEAAERIAACLVPHGRVLTLQNGLGNREILAERLGAEQVWAGSTTTGGTMIAPGRVRHAGAGPTHLPLGWEDVAELFNAAGLVCHLTDNVEQLLWGKLVLNAAINPLSALLRQPNGFLGENALVRELMFLAAEEAAAVASAVGIALPYGDVRGRLLALTQATAANHSSMLQDVLRGAPTEIEAITGQVVKYGRQYAIPTPMNDLFWRLMG